METIYTKVDEGTIKKTVTETIETWPYFTEYERLKSDLIEIEKEPDEIIMPNVNKMSLISALNSRIAELESIYNQIQ